MSVQVTDVDSLCGLIGEHLILYEAVADDAAALRLCQQIWVKHCHTSPPKPISSTSSSSSKSSLLTSDPPRLAAPVRIEQEQEPDLAPITPSIPNVTFSVLPDSNKTKKVRSKSSSSSSSPSLAPVSEAKDSKKKVVTIKTGSVSTQITNNGNSHSAKPTSNENKSESEEEDDDEDETDDVALVPQRLESYFHSGVSFCFLFSF